MTAPLDDVLPEARALLERRAAALRLRPAAADEGAVTWFTQLTLGAESYAIPLAMLRAAIPLRAVTPVPLSPAHVIGVLRFEGRIISALSLAALLEGLQPEGMGEGSPLPWRIRGWRQDPAFLLVVEAGRGRVVALDCEEIPKPVVLPQGCRGAGRPRPGGAVVDIVTPDGAPLGVIDLPRLLAVQRTGDGRGH